MRPEIPDLAGGRRQPSDERARQDAAATARRGELLVTTLSWGSTITALWPRKSAIARRPRPVCSPGVTPDWSSVA